MAKLHVTSVQRTGNAVSVTITGGEEGEASNLWVAMKSYDEGGLVDDLVAIEHLPVVWSDERFPTEGRAGAFHPAGFRQDVYVWKYPDAEKALRVA